MSAQRRAMPHRLAWILASTPLLSAVVFWRPGLDVFGFPKFGVLVLGVAAAAAVAIHDSVSAGRVHLVWGPPAGAAGAFAILMLGVFLLRPSVLGFLGAFSRHTGALFYILVALAALLMMGAGAVGDGARWITTRGLALGVLGTGAVVGAYGVLQLVGADPLEWTHGGRIATATFGNPNFTAALLGASVPASVWAAWDRAHATSFRVAGVLTLAATSATVIGTRSVQGPVTAAAGLLVFSLAVILGLQDQRVRKSAIGAWMAATLAGGAIGVASLLGRGPFGGLADAANVELRSFYWSAGLRMFAENPVMGVGLERYGAYFGVARSDAAARRLDLEFAVDAAHNVPIQLFATGGILVGLAYLAFVVLTAMALVLAFRRTAARPRLLVGALGGIWAAYQVQSFVSIETPPLALLHWLSASAIASWAGTVSLRTVDLPWVSSQRRHDVRFRQRISGPLLLVAVVALGLWLLRPLQASTAAAQASALADAGRFNEALSELDTATARAPWEPAYWQQFGDVALRAERMDRAMDAYRQALDLEPRSIIALVTAARIADQTGDTEGATELYGRALEVEPSAPALLEEAARFFEEQGDEARARNLRSRADRVLAR